MSPEQENYSPSNEQSWEHAIQRHNSYKGDFANGIKQGVHVFPKEIEELFDRDLSAGLLQPFCNDGRELVYLCKKKHVRGVGVDFSESATAFASHLAKALQVDAAFYCEDVLDWFAAKRVTGFSVCFITLGSIWWVEDIDRFFDQISRCLVPGGSLVFWDFHPITYCVDEHQRLTRDYPFEKRALTHSSGITNYVAASESYDLVARAAEVSDDKETFSNPYPVIDFRRSLSDILSSLFAVRDLKISSFKELDFLWQERYFPWLKKCSDGKFRAGPQACAIPLAFYCVATKRK